MIVKIHNFTTQHNSFFREHHNRNTICFSRCSQYVKVWKLWNRCENTLCFTISYSAIKLLLEKIPFYIFGWTDSKNVTYSNNVVLWIVGIGPSLEGEGLGLCNQFLEDTMREPSRLKWTAETGSEWAGRFFNCFPVFTSQIRTDSSKLPDTIKLDWGLKPQHKT